MTPEKPRHDGEWVSVPRAYLEHVLGTLEYLRESEPYGDVNVDYDLSLALGQTKTHLAASPATAALCTQEGETVPVRFIELQNLWKALQDLGIDNGWHPDPKAVVPPEWENTCRAADAQIGRMSDDERETFAMGEETEMESIREKYTAQAAFDVLNAAFGDGPLTFLQSVHTTAVEHVSYESSVLAERELASQARTIEALRAAVKPFADFALLIPAHSGDDELVHDVTDVSPRVKDFRRALKEHPNG